MCFFRADVANVELNTKYEFDPVAFSLDAKYVNSKGDVRPLDLVWVCQILMMVGAVPCRVLNGEAGNDKGSRGWALKLSVSFGRDRISVHVFPLRFPRLFL